MSHQLKLLGRDKKKIERRQNLVVYAYTSTTAKAATDPKNWIRDPAGSDPDPDPLTHGTYSIGEKIPKT